MQENTKTAQFENNILAILELALKSALKTLLTRWNPKKCNLIKSSVDEVLNDNKTKRKK